MSLCTKKLTFDLIVRSVRLAAAAAIFRMSGLLLDFIISKTKEYLTIFSYTLESAMWPCQLSESGEIKVKLWSIPRLHQLFWMINVNILNVFWTCAESKPTHRCKLSQHAFRIQSNKNCLLYMPNHLGVLQQSLMLFLLPYRILLAPPPPVLARQGLHGPAAAGP